MLILGSRHHQPTGPQVFWDAALLRPHRHAPYVQHWLHKRYGLDLRPPGPNQGAVALVGNADFAVDPGILALHTLVFGASGAGKTRLALHLLHQQLQAGCSAVVMDTSGETLRQAQAMAKRAGLRDTQITLLWPRERRYGMPGWNSLAVPLERQRDAVAAFVDTMKAIFGASWGARMENVLRNALTVVAGQRLSLVELMAFLTEAEYREGLLAQAHGSDAWHESRPRHDYWQREFAALSKGDVSTYVQPITNKLLTFVDQPFLRSLLCAPHDTLDLASLWERPRLLLVHLDENALGDDGVTLLAGLLTQSLYRQAVRRDGKGAVPVLLMLDEIASQERFAGDALRWLLDKSRKSGMRLLIAGQHLGQMSEGLRASLLTSTALRVFFRLNPEDAGKVARTLGQGGGERLVRVTLEVPKPAKDEPVRTVSVSHVLQDAWGGTLTMSASAWAAFQTAQAACVTTAQWLEVLNELLQASDVGRTYAVLDGTAYEINGYVAHLPRDCVRLSGPDPLKLVITFPFVKVSGLEYDGEEELTRRLARELTRLPVREAIAWEMTREAARITVVPVELPDPPDMEPLLRGGQSAADVRGTLEARYAGIVRLARGLPPVSAAPSSPAPISDPARTAAFTTVAEGADPLTGNRTSSAGTDAGQTRKAIGPARNNRTPAGCARIEPARTPPRIASSVSAKAGALRPGGRETSAETTGRSEVVREPRKTQSGAEKGVEKLTEDGAEVDDDDSL